MLTVIFWMIVVLAMLRTFAGTYANNEHGYSPGVNFISAVITTGALFGAVYYLSRG